MKEEEEEEESDDEEEKIDSSENMGQYIKIPAYGPTQTKLRKTPYKKYTINVLNKDNLCIKYCIVLKKFMKKILTTIRTKSDLTDPNTLKPYLKYIKDQNVQYPINVRDTKKLEEQNKIRINIFVSFILIFNFITIFSNLIILYIMF